ncbi:calcium uniporter regulatory subunit MCUb, mitochondrial isoform X2 [Neofelis nebulosa]|uniref:calcium uniporter regulatory subunit MCUb, mitochondrial isoform X2 n=1 Tax=Neofelis nebulosa TaxID=61452 RepID=UPI00272D6339|nr:calcium uniporter regulatory subunit MCUb, mitochondrial isoform X2 [Neofelis nebulosa]
MGLLKEIQMCSIYTVPICFQVRNMSRRYLQVLCVKLCGNLKYSQSHLYSTVVPPDEITVNYRHGLPLITLTLPSRKERCQFVVKPMLSTVGSFLRDLQNEDKGVKTAAILTADGREIPATTLMEILLMNDFKLVINKITYDVQCPKKEKPSMEHATDMENVKSLVHRLFTALHLEEFQKKREHHLLEKIDHLRGQLQPLEQIKAGIEARSEAKTSGLLWAGLALLSVQGGALAWLTWWVYSWDIMEPVTYFITFANSMVFFAYFIVTRQDYTYSAVKSRQFLHFFHKKSKQQHFDVVQYNKLKEDLAKENTKPDPTSKSQLSKNPGAGGASSRPASLPRFKWPDARQERTVWRTKAERARPSAGRRYPGRP